MKSKTEKLLDELVKLHPKYIDLSLDRLKLLLKKLDNPQDYLPKTIHIAGTNGILIATHLIQPLARMRMAMGAAPRLLAPPGGRSTTI